jgi:hypothetical protein
MKIPDRWAMLPTTSAMDHWICGGWIEFHSREWIKEIEFNTFSSVVL